MSPSALQIDGRRLRSERSRQAIIEAYLALLHETSRMPTAARIAEQAGCSTRLVFERFKDLFALNVATADYALAQARLEATARHVDGDRATRIRSQVETRARICERWLPFWRIAKANQAGSKEFRDRIEHVRRASLERLKLMYRRELSTLPDAERERLLVALGALIDFDSWDQMRNEHNLSAEAARAVWIQAIDRLLPSTPRPE
jgi:AcrR family transcriptional regulator